MVRKKYSGGKLTICCLCGNNHDTEWKSSFDIRAMAEINLCSAAAVLYSGSTYTEISEFFSLANIPFLSAAEYYRIQRTYLIPTINSFYQEKLAEIHLKLLADESCSDAVTLMGDGR